VIAAPLLRAPLLSATPGVVHGFSTREGGVSQGSLGSLNLALRQGEEPPRLVENWRRVCLALDPSLDPDDLVLLTQVHGADVVTAERPSGPLDTLADADAAVTTRPGLVLAVRTADCVPVLLAAPGGVAVAHAGWRGTAAGVVPATVATLAQASGCDPGQVTAAIGPCISGAAYEVGDEVVEGLLAGGLREADVLVSSPGPKPHVDIGRAVQAQLHACGVTQIDWLQRCTYGEGCFHSHRRDGPPAGRLAGVIARLG
jgi:YfiH family protein